MLRNSESRRPGGRRRGRVRTAGVLGAVVLAGSFALGGCGSSGEDSGTTASSVSGEQAAPDQGMPRREAGAQAGPESSDSSAPADASGPADTAQAAERHVIRTATLTVRAQDVQDGLDEARAAAATAGGYVEQESTDRDADGEEHSRITFKVPPEEYQGFLATLAGIGELEQREVSTDDVTGEVVDVESRIRTQRASVTRVRELMDDATQLSDVVTLEAELSSRQADLEALQARLKSLESRSGMATVTLELRTPHAAPPDEDGDTTVGGALSGGWDAFATMLRWIAIALGASLPFVAALALLYAAWRGARRIVPALPRRRVAPPAKAEAPGPAKASPGDTA